MPIARPTVIPFVCEWLSQKSIKDIKSVLDIGSGFGIWGFLSREYIQIWKADITKEEYINWRKTMRVDAIEIADWYNTELQKIIYNKIHVGNMKNIIPKLGFYDLVIMGDVLEHVNLEDGRKLVDEIRKKSKWLIITMPDYFARCEAKMGNEAEIHQYVWKDEDFFDYPQITHVGNQKVIIYDNQKYANKK